MAPRTSYIKTVVVNESYVLLYFIDTYVPIPSASFILGKASLKVLAKPGCVWILTLQASIGARAMSAKNSALALAAKYNVVLYRKAFSYGEDEGKNMKLVRQ